MSYNCRMVRSLCEKQPYPIFAAILVLVVLGTFVFPGVEISRDIEMSGNRPYSNGVVVPLDHTVDWLAENTITVNRTKRVSSFSLRSNVPRVVLLYKIHSAVEYSLFSSVHTVNPNYFLNSKNTIPLKLRI